MGQASDPIGFAGWAGQRRAWACGSAAGPADAADTAEAAGFAPRFRDRRRFQGKITPASEARIMSQASPITPIIAIAAYTLSNCR